MPSYLTIYGATFGLIFCFWLLCFAISRDAEENQGVFWDGLFGCALLALPLSCAPYFGLKLLLGLAAA